MDTTKKPKIYEINFEQKNNFNDIQDMNFEELDAYLEKKAHKSKK